MHVHAGVNIGDIGMGLVHGLHTGLAFLFFLFTFGFPLCHSLFLQI